MNAQQFNKLPQYAKDEFRRLMNDNEALQDRLNQFNGEKDSPISWLATMGSNRPIPDGTIRFLLEDDQYADVRINNGNLYVNFSHGMVIRPFASNAVEIYPNRL